MILIIPLILRYVGEENISGILIKRLMVKKKQQSKIVWNGQKDEDYIWKQYFHQFTDFLFWQTDGLQTGNVYMIGIE